MRTHEFQFQRNPSLPVLVYSLMAALWFGGCATPREEPDADPTAGAQATAEPAPNGPFEVARGWVDAFSADEAPDAVRQVVGGWKTAQLARVWAAGEEYRAVVVQKSTARETPAVLLRITHSDASGWEVSGVEPTTSTHLWSEL